MHVGFSSIHAPLEDQKGVIIKSWEPDDITRIIYIKFNSIFYELVSNNPELSLYVRFYQLYENSVYAFKSCDPHERMNVSTFYQGYSTIFKWNLMGDEAETEILQTANLLNFTKNGLEENTLNVSQVNNIFSITLNESFLFFSIFKSIL